MSILITGMEIPKPGHIVLVEIDENGDVFAAYDGGRTKLTQHKAVPVPPHVRLIDADALTRAQGFRNYKYDNGLVYVEVGEVISLINAAPTIIPADGGAE